MDADELEEVFTFLTAFEVLEFFGVEIDIDESDELVFRIDDGESEEPVKGEEFAGIEDGRAAGDGDDGGDHHVRDGGVGGSAEEFACGDDAEELVFGIDDVEVDDTSTDLMVADVLDGLGDGEVGADTCGIGPHVLLDGVGENLMDGGHETSLFKSVFLSPVVGGVLRGAIPN